MIKNITFQYTPGIIRLNKVSPFGANTDVNINNYYDPKDTLGYIDWTTLNIKKGDTIYYDAPDRDSKGLRKGTFTKTKIGAVNADPLFYRVVSDTAIGEELFQANTNGRANIYITRDLNLSGKYLYSYPLTSYVGAATYTQSILSLFFERTSGVIDEVRLNISTNRHHSILKGLLRSFKDEKIEDLYIGEGEIRDFYEAGNFIFNVNKVITSISKNRN